MKNKTVGVFIGVAVLVVGGLLLASDRIQERSADGEMRLTIATSFYPLEFALEQIVGDLGVVTNIGSGRDPHDFRPSTQDMVTLQRADVVVLQGADFEPWGDDVIARLESDGIPVLLATAEIDLHEGGHDNHDDHLDDHSQEEQDHMYEDEHVHEDEIHHQDENHIETAHDHTHNHGVYDPHTWLDPVLFSQTVEYLVAELALLDPTNASVYQTNAAALQVELANLNTQYVDQLTTCALDEVITSHDAFGYVGDRYNFTVHAIAGLSTQDSPSATTLAELRAEAAEGIGAILLEENSIAAYGETLARETGLQTLHLNPIAYIIPEGETYLTLMRQNLDTFTTALQCNV